MVLKKDVCVVCPVCEGIVATMNFDQEKQMCIFCVSGTDIGRFCPNCECIVPSMDFNEEKMLCKRCAMDDIKEGDIVCRSCGDITAPSNFDFKEQLCCNCMIGLIMTSEEDFEGRK